MINFAEVEKSVRILTHQFANGEIGEKALEEKLLKLIDVAADGNYWMFGHRSGRWFRYDGQSWISDTPGATLLAQAIPSISHEQDNLPDWTSLDWSEVLLHLFVLLTIGGVTYYYS